MAKLTEQQKKLNRLILERGRLAMKESMLGTKFDLVKNRIREVETEIREMFKQVANADNDGLPRLSEDEKRACAEGNHILAIKSIRERLNIGLIEAKNAVDHYREKNGLVQRAN